MVLYGICFILGGIFVLLSIVGGFDGLDLDIDSEIEVDDIDFGTHDLAADRERSRQQRQARATKSRRKLWLPFFSFRFWTFGVCFFGLTGLLVTLIEPDLGSQVIALIAGVMGLICGTAAAVVLRSVGMALRSQGKEGISSMVTPSDLVGQIGTVEIPFDTNSRGKVRLSLKGSTLGFSALTTENRSFQPGEKVLVIGMEQNKLWIVSTDLLETHSPAPP